MFKLSAARKVGGYYEPVKHYIEDYILFTRLLEHGLVSNINRSLIQYRFTPSSLSLRNRNPELNSLIQAIVSKGFALDSQLCRYHDLCRLNKERRMVIPPVLFKSLYFLRCARLAFVYGASVRRFFKFILLAGKASLGF